MYLDSFFSTPVIAFLFILIFLVLLIYGVILYKILQRNTDNKNTIKSDDIQYESTQSENIQSSDDKIVAAIIATITAYRSAESVTLTPSNSFRVVSFKRMK